MVFFSFLCGWLGEWRTGFLTGVDSQTVSGEGGFTSLWVLTHCRAQFGSHIRSSKLQYAPTTSFFLTSQRLQRFSAYGFITCARETRGDFQNFLRSLQFHL